MKFRLFEHHYELFIILSEKMFMQTHFLKQYFVRGTECFYIRPVFIFQIQQEI